MDAITPDTTGSAASEMADDFITVALQPDTALESSITPQELLEFLQADIADVSVDPQFTERLRQQLWQMVQQQALRLRAASTAEKCPMSAVTQVSDTQQRLKPYVARA